MPTHAPANAKTSRERPVKPAAVPKLPAEATARSSLSHAELLEIARRNPPPAEWFDDDSDPFTPAPEPAEG